MRSFPQLLSRIVRLVRASSPPLLAKLSLIVGPSDHPGRNVPPQLRIQCGNVLSRAVLPGQTAPLAPGRLIADRLTGCKRLVSSRSWDDHAALLARLLACVHAQ